MTYLLLTLKTLKYTGFLVLLKQTISMGLKYELAISWVSKPSMSHAVTNKKSLNCLWGFFVVVVVVGLNMHIYRKVILDAITKNTDGLLQSCLDDHCYHHFALWAQSIQTGSEHSMAAGWNSSFCCSQVTTQRVASPLLLFLCLWSVCQTLWIQKTERLAEMYRNKSK